MCGRYTLAKPLEDILTHFNLTKVRFDFQERFNITPSQKAPVIVSNNHERALQEMRWGLVPPWVTGKQPSWINARSETVHEKTAFKHSFKNRRCLIPADGFFEWKKTENDKTPYYFFHKTKNPFAFAGLWEKQQDKNATAPSFCILTVTANNLVKKHHHRMPVILPQENYLAWLDATSDPGLLHSFLVPLPSEQMDSHAVSKLVNNPKNDLPECLHSLD